MGSNPSDTTMEHEIENWIETIIQSKHDPFVRIQFADWLDDYRLIQQACGQRWLVKHEQRPSRLAYNGPYHCRECYYLHSIERVSFADMIMQVRIIYRIFPKVHNNDNENEKGYLDICKYFSWDEFGEPSITVHGTVGF